MRELTGLLDRAICDEPSILLTEGNLIRRGYDAELDRLHGLKDNAREVLDSYLAEERAATGIGSLKLRYNKIIGYSFEVTKSNLAAVPPHFIRRQSLVGGERYTTDRLADLESEINDASERIVEIERTLFLEVRAKVLAAVPWLLSVCDAISELDVFQSMAFAATVHGYVRPTMTEGTELSIQDGRHPVVEAHLPGGAFVPNSLDCPGTGRFFVILTGPNMAGKSTYLRQVALIALMAQMGSFVPAARRDHRHRGQGLLPGGGDGQPGAGRIDVSRGDERDGAHPARGHAAQPRHHGRNRQGHEHAGRPCHRVGGVHVHPHAHSGAHPVRDPFPRADPARARECGKPFHGRARHRRGGRLSQEGARRPFEQFLRDPRGAAGGTPGRDPPACRDDARQAQRRGRRWRRATRMRLRRHRRQP